MRRFDIQIAELYDLDPLWKTLAVVHERYGEDTPHLLPRDVAPVANGRRAAARDAEIIAFAAWRRGQIDVLEARWPRLSEGVRAAWEAWWRVNAPSTSTSRSTGYPMHEETTS